MDAQENVELFLQECICLHDDASGHGQVQALVGLLLPLRNKSMLSESAAQRIAEAYNCLHDHDKSSLRVMSGTQTHCQSKDQTLLLPLPLSDATRCSNQTPAKPVDSGRVVERLVRELCLLHPSPVTMEGKLMEPWTLVLRDYAHIRSLVMSCPLGTGNSLLQLPDITETAVSECCSQQVKQEEKPVVVEQSLPHPPPPLTAEEPVVPVASVASTRDVGYDHTYHLPVSTARVSKPTRVLQAPGTSGVVEGDSHMHPLSQETAVSKLSKELQALIASTLVRGDKYDAHTKSTPGSRLIKALQSLGVSPGDEGCGNTRHLPISTAGSEATDVLPAPGASTHVRGNKYSGHTKSTAGSRPTQALQSPGTSHGDDRYGSMHHLPVNTAGSEAIELLPASVASTLVGADESDGHTKTTAAARPTKALQSPVASTLVDGSGNTNPLSKTTARSEATKVLPAPVASTLVRGGKSNGHTKSTAGPRPTQALQAPGTSHGDDRYGSMHHLPVNTAGSEATKTPPAPGASTLIGADKSDCHAKTTAESRPTKALQTPAASSLVEGDSPMTPLSNNTASSDATKVLPAPMASTLVGGDMSNGHTKSTGGSRLTKALLQAPGVSTSDEGYGNMHHLPMSTTGSEATKVPGASTHVRGDKYDGHAKSTKAPQGPGTSVLVEGDSNTYPPLKTMARPEATEVLPAPGLSTLVGGDKYDGHTNTTAASRPTFTMPTPVVSAVGEGDGPRSTLPAPGASSGDEAYGSMHHLPENTAGSEATKALQAPGASTTMSAPVGERDGPTHPPLQQEEKTAGPEPTMPLGATSASVTLILPPFTENSTTPPQALVLPAGWKTVQLDVPPSVQTSITTTAPDTVRRLPKSTHWYRRKRQARAKAGENVRINRWHADVYMCGKCRKPRRTVVNGELTHTQMFGVWWCRGVDVPLKEWREQRRAAREAKKRKPPPPVPRPSAPGPDIAS
ncbi:uncharacterized protein LOC143274833 [Babylonia areolata]|uniref:uncharacterized protein LOC143274833 n=1 Tax=Babylonia areolata TaxID=304850 RepID=UPI003FD4096D